MVTRCDDGDPHNCAAILHLGRDPPARWVQASSVADGRNDFADVVSLDEMADWRSNMSVVFNLHKSPIYKKKIEGSFLFHMKGINITYSVSTDPECRLEHYPIKIVRRNLKKNEC